MLQMSIQCLDLNPGPSEQESPPETTFDIGQFLLLLMAQYWKDNLAIWSHWLQPW